MGRIRHIADRWGSLILFLPVGVLVWADAREVALRTETLVGLGAWFVVVAGVNLERVAKYGLRIAAAAHKFQQSLPPDEKENKK